jgi:hypothetical protein
MSVENISDTTKKRVALELINQEISALTLTKRYYNEGKYEDEILECVERDMKQTHPEILNVILGKYIREMKDYLNTDGVSIDCQISDLIKDRGYLQNALRPIRTRENRLFTPKRVVTKPLTIPFNNIKESATFRMAQNWVGKGYTIVFNHMGVRTRYNHDDLYEKIWRWLHEAKRAGSYPKHGHYSTYTIPQDLLKVPGVSELIKREQIQAA